MAQTKSIDVVTLGCSKNLVDSERVVAMLEKAGFKVRHREEPATDGSTDIAIINTCGFIGDAKEESIETILRAARAKQLGRLKEIHVMGCLSQRYREELSAEIVEVDSWWGKYDWTGIVAMLGGSHATAVEPMSAPGRSIATAGHHAYLKIAEGCGRGCAFCAIPIITGRYRSRPFDEIVTEAQGLSAAGVTELNVIAQDLSGYGHDLYGGSRLADLVKRLSDIEKIRRIRLHYAYPADFPYDVLDVMAERENVCKYLDIALQHCSDKILKAMHRRITAEQQEALIDEIRARVPDICLRTTLMTGFPGEGEKEFEELLDFTRRRRFERMGAFAYCEEEGTPAAKLYRDSVPAEVKQNRLDRLMALQEEISAEIQQQKVGSRLEVVIDREEQDYYVGRTQWDSPEVDPEVLVRKTASLSPGDYCMVKIDEAMPFELIATPEHPSDV